jgi:hypothetical protein
MPAAASSLPCDPAEAELRDPPMEPPTCKDTLRDCIDSDFLEFEQQIMSIEKCFSEDNHASVIVAPMMQQHTHMGRIYESLHEPAPDRLVKEMRLALQDIPQVRVRGWIKLFAVSFLIKFA